MNSRIIAVFCDDIREEVSGKQFLIGTYGGEMLVSALPHKSTLSLWVRLQGIDVGEHRFAIDIEGPEGMTPIHVDHTLTHPNPDAVGNINLVGFPLEVHAPGRLVARFTLDDQPPFEIASLLIGENSAQ